MEQDLSCTQKPIEESTVQNQSSVRNTRNYKTLETLNFDNSALNNLPIDSVDKNYVRSVPNACLSRVAPTPITSPK